LFKLILEAFHEKILRIKEFQLKRQQQDDNEEHYESLITQNNALQMIFDLKFLNILFDAKEDSASVSGREISCFRIIKVFHLGISE
jgi:hypothetical protein